MSGIVGTTFVAVCASTGITVPTAPSAAATWSPETSTHVLAPIVVTSLADAGPGSLREALLTANASLPGASTVIDFAVNGTITLASSLPAIVRDVTIDGTSAPTHVNGGPPVLEIDFNGHGGLVFAAGSDGSELLGVAADNANGNGVTLNASSITLNENHIGLDLSGAPSGNHGHGVYVSASSSGNTIGLNASGASGAVSNVISGNTGSGIVLSGSSGNTVASNRIGTNVAGTARIANGGNGLLITGGSNGNRIGGTVFVDSATGLTNNPTGSKGTTTPVFIVPPLGNLISGNTGTGVTIDAGSHGNVLNGNFIGTSANGDSAIGNSGDGVRINRADRNSLVGCAFVNNPFVYYNVISGNGGNGLRITSSNNVVVQGNFFGVGADNTTIVANRLNGIRVGGSSANTQVGGVIPLGNVSSGNGRNGIAVTGTAHGFISFNTFGGLLAFKGAAPNRRDGLLIRSTGGDNLARTNVFSGNIRNGIELAGRASGVTIDPNIAGLTTNGGSALHNGRDGIRIRGAAHNNKIGGSFHSVILQNTFSGNLGHGIAIVGRAHHNRVFKSFIGTNIGGLAAIGNDMGGVLIGGKAHHNEILGTKSRPRNLISGNTGNGVTLRKHTHDNRVVKNRIGLDRLGGSLPNTGRPIVDKGQQNTIRLNRY